MYAFPIGVMLDSFRLDIPAALAAAQEVGAQGLQVYATSGEMAPENLSAEKRREFAARVADKGLAISALCGDLGHGFGDPAKNPGLIEKSKRILDLACELGTNIVTTHIGVVPAHQSHPRYAVMQEACAALAAYAHSLGAYFAIETGPETSAVLKGFLDSLPTRGLAVNLDPANLVMVTQDDPVQAVYTLRDYIVHTHAKDGRFLRYKNPEVIYGLLPDTDFGGPAFAELPLGQGQVDFPRYLAALEDISYTGYLTIEREVGADPKKDIAAAVHFLHKLTRG